MSRRSNEANHPFYGEIAKALTERLRELGVSKNYFCIENRLCRNTFDRLTRNQLSIAFNTLLEYLDAAGLELKIVKKQ